MHPIPIRLSVLYKYMRNSRLCNKLCISDLYLNANYSIFECIIRLRANRISHLSMKYAFPEFPAFIIRLANKLPHCKKETN